ncbi:hypothetical protein ACLG6S_00290 [Thermodesulfobacteriota bacterium B35]
MNRNFVLLLTVLLLCLTGCRDEQPGKAPSGPAPAQEPAPQPPPRPGCRGCHGELQIDAGHDFACTDCHDGDNTTADRDRAHAGLVARPAHPDRMARRCGRCHEKQVQGCEDSLHFTLKKAVNLVRQHFGANAKLDRLTEIPVSESPANRIELVDDMLRRRCLRCHVYSPGDNYAYVRRGTGCAACHLEYADGHLQSHVFLARPADRQCLSCHYANRVGADFHGRFEHDFNWEYRTPYTTRQPFIRPYGVEYHDLSPDIHQQRGMICIDCHSGETLMATGGRRITCRTCHAWQPGDRKPELGNIRVEDGSLVLTGRGDGARHQVVPFRDPAHEKYGRKVACQVCHAQWIYNDSTTSLLRSDTDDYEMWDRLTVQSDSWVEAFLDHNLYSDEDELEPAMPDGITGEMRPGIWYLGYGQRRWEDFIIRRDRQGVIRIFRPILDLRLSFMDEDEMVRFDNLRGRDDGLRPYTPHTTGPAGMFYRQRFSDLLQQDQQTESMP